jgi:hypothetical protein
MHLVMTWEPRLCDEPAELRRNLKLGRGSTTGVDQEWSTTVDNQSSLHRRADGYRNMMIRVGRHYMSCFAFWT